MDIEALDHPLGARLLVRVKPRASRSAILPPQAGQLVVSLAAPPVDGEANAELVRLLADALNLPKTRVVVVSGPKSRNKLLQFQGLAAPELLSRLEAAIARQRK